jgi:hypothetical protein
MNAPTVSTVSQHTSLHYRVTVVAPHSGGTNVAITGYEILFKQIDGVTYTAITADCPTAGATITNLYCDVSLTSLTATPFSLSLGAEVVAKVRAQNTLGDGDFSAASDSSGTALIVTIPTAPPSVPYRDEATCSETSITINMPVMAGQTATGGLSILSYKLEMAVGAAGAFSALVGDGPASTATSYTKTGLTTGDLYRFRYIVSNEVGWSSDYSPILTTYSAVAPGLIAAPTTAIDGLGVRFSWTAPTTGGLTITGYNVQIRATGSTYTLETTYCSVTATQCTVPLLDLQASPYSLVLGDLVQAKVSATNLVGEGLESS